jgi:hypothetical protein
MPDAGGTANLAVSASHPSCEWTVTGTPAWVTIITGANGQGSGTVSYAVAANEATDPRQAVLTIGGAAHAIHQAGRAPAPTCHYTIEPHDDTFPSAGGTGSLTVTAEDGCTWTATANASWISLAPDAAGSGAGTVVYTVAANTSTDSRTGTVAVADQTLTISQAGLTAACEYRVRPVTFSPCMAAGTLDAVLETGAACRWTATTTTPWLQITSATSGRGPETIRIRYSDNYDAPRNGVVMVRWPTPTAGQNLHVAQAGCRYAVTKTTVDVPAAGGSGSFEVFQQSDPTNCGGPTQDACIWSATADVSWITITTSMPRAGDHPVTFNVAANPGSAPRTGHIRVRDKTVTIAQPGTP